MAGNLPPGVTDADIDRAAGADDEPTWDDLGELLMPKETFSNTLRDIADGTVLLRVNGGRTVSASMLTKAADRIDRLEAALEGIDAVAVDHGHYEAAARTMQEVARTALFGDDPR